MHKKSSSPLGTSSVNVTKSVVSCVFGHIYWKKILDGKLYFLRNEIAMILGMSGKKSMVTLMEMMNLSNKQWWT